MMKTKKLFLIAAGGVSMALAMTLAMGAFAQGMQGFEPQPADQPAERTDSNSKLAHEQLLEKAREGSRNKSIGVYFEGDSITRRWGAIDYPQFLEHWNRNFFGWNAADFGWGADSTQNILWRLQNGELDGVNPKVIVLLAGTNNIGAFIAPGAQDAKVEDVTKGISAILKVMREKAPEATILLTAIFPRNDNAKDPKAVIPIINRINKNLAAMADGKKVRYLDINDKLADAEGILFDGMTVDKLHLAIPGYQLWADALKPLFHELIGPASKEDHAPPPTGDPSAK
jgi:lysophospholipase L1-like esterase